MSQEITKRLYRYEGLLQAIDFFTQRFSVEQLFGYSFEFANEILTLHRSALFIREGDDFILRNSKVYPFQSYTIANNAKLKSIPSFFGQVIHNDFHAFFNQEDIEKLNMRLVIPLIIHDDLFGFIISDGKSVDEMNEDDFTISNTLMRLINNSLENSHHFSELQKSNRELDQKIFNLFAINQSTKALLSEVTLHKLISTATDVFSEVSGSKITSFGIYDPMIKKIKMVGYRNVVSYTKFYTEFGLQSLQYKGNKIVLSIENDLPLIQSIFIDWEQFYELGAKYIVLIVKDELFGIVTLSDSVLHQTYDSSVFELVESLATSTYIAISNAIMFETIQWQKETIEKKLVAMTALNKLVKTINRSATSEELRQLTLKGLRLSFEVEKAFFCLKQSDDSYRIVETLASTASILDQTFQLNKEWAPTFTNETIYNFSAGGIHSFFDQAFADQLGESNCIVLSPLSLGGSMAEEKGISPYGYLVVIATAHNLHEADILVFDIIAKNITPILNQMEINEQLLLEHIPNTRKLFLDMLHEKIADRESYEIDFYLYYYKVNKHPFKPFSIAEFGLDFLSEFEYYLLDAYLFVFTYEELNHPEFNLIPEPHEVGKVMNYTYSF